MMRHVAAIVLMVLGIGYAAHADRAAAQDDFYHGKTIKLMIGTGPGGGYDTYGRLVARHIGRHIPGNPSVIPQNQPGASSLVLTNYLFNSAPHDGTIIGIINQAMPIEQYLKSPNTNYDVNKFNWIGRVSSAVEMAIVWHTVPVNTIQDVFTRETLMGGTGPTSSTEFVPRLLNNLAGTKFRVISGFSGTSAIALAMERGEVEGSATPLESLTSYRADWVRDKRIKKFSCNIRASATPRLRLFRQWLNSARLMKANRFWLSMPPARISGGRSWPHPVCRRSVCRHCERPSTQCSRIRNFWPTARNWVFR